MKTSKLKKFERSPEKPITPQMHRANCERVADMLMSVVDRLPVNVPPVAEGLENLMDGLRHGVKRSPVVVNMHDGKRVAVRDGVTEIITPAINFQLTKNDLSDAEGMQKNVTCFNSDELELLRKIENGER